MNSEIKTLAQVAIEVLLIIRIYTLISSGLGNTDIAFSCNNMSSVVLGTVSVLVSWPVCKVLGGFDLVFPNKYLSVLIGGNNL